MAHLNDLYEAQAKALLTKLCDALGMEDEDRTKSGIEAAIAQLRSDAAIEREIDRIIEDEEYLNESDEEAEIERH
jgi:hypothetical protein